MHLTVRQGNICLRSVHSFTVRKPHRDETVTET